MKKFRFVVMTILFTFGTIFGTWAFAEPVRVQQEEQKYEVAWTKKRNLNRQIHRRNKRIYQRKKRQQRKAVHHFAHHNRGCFISTLQED